MTLEFVDEIYEAAAIPERWAGAGILEKLAGIGQCRDGILFAIDPVGQVRWVSNDAAAGKMEVYVRDNWVALNPYLETVARIEKFREPRFVMDTEVMSADEMENTTYYRDFMRPYGCYWHTGTSISAPSGDVIKLSVHRSYDEGPLPRSATEHLTALRPHLARAVLIAARLRFEQVKATVDALDTIGLAAGAVKNGKLVAAGAGFQKLIPAVLQDRHDRLTFMSPSAQKCWQRLKNPDLMRLGGSFPIEASESQAAMVVHVLPIAGAAHDIFGAADLLLAVTIASKTSSIDDSILMALYDLTPAESQVAREIALGRDVKTIAKSRTVSIGTVRTQLHSIFEKTGAQRQVELARLVFGLSKMN